MHDVSGEGRAHVKLSAKLMFIYWLTQFAAYLALLTPLVITIAVKLAHMVPANEKAGYLGAILGAGAFGSFVAAPIFGAISDHTRSRFRRRKLWIMVGSASLLSGLAVMSLAATPLWLGIGWFICQVGSNIGQPSLQATLSDAVPPEQHGIMSALLSGSVTVAIATGVFLTRYTAIDDRIMFLVPWLLSPIAILLFVTQMPDAPATSRVAGSLSLLAILKSLWLNPVRYPDFGWAFLSRFIVMLAVACSLSYQVYYLTDQLHVRQKEVADYMFLSTTIMGVLSLSISLVAGRVSDFVGRRKPFVGGAAAVLATGLFLIAHAQTFNQFLVAAALTSIGQGLYVAVDFALCVEVIPSRGSAGKDLAVLQMASSLPQSLAPTVAPLLLGIGSTTTGNYMALFTSAAICAVVGALAVIPIRKVR
jgi:MFS family permease